jgi:SAM-dependent methyltransferase
MSWHFDPRDPFPLALPNSLTYAQEKEHAKAVDQFLGFEIDQVELRLREASPKSNHAAQWIGLAPESLQTPYTEIRHMLSKLDLNPGDTVVDLGAGYGRMGLVLNAHYPECRFLGIEISKPRVDEGNRVYRLHGIKPDSCLVQADASDSAFLLPEARAYFLYDLSLRATIKQVIDKLKERSQAAPILVVGRGRATRDQIERKEPWLSQIVEPKHCGNFSIYSSR